MNRRVVLSFVGLTVFLFAACQVAKKNWDHNSARMKLRRAISTSEIRGNPVDLSLKVLDHAFEDMDADDGVKTFGVISIALMQPPPGYRLLVGDLHFDLFKARSMGQNFIRRDEVVVVSKEQDNGDIVVEAPIRTYELKRTESGAFNLFVNDRPGNSGHDLIESQARLFKSLDPGQYAEIVEVLREYYPGFEL